MDTRTLFRKCYTTAPVITARDVAIALAEPFIVFCNNFVEEDLKDPADAFQNLLLIKGKEHEKELTKNAKEIQYKTEEEGFHIILQELINGTELIHEAPLIFKTLHGRADLLEKNTTHESTFGNFHYVIKEIKLAKNIKQKHILQAAFYTYIIGQIQDYTPEFFYIINGEKEEFKFEYKEYEGLLKESIQEAKDILNGKKVRPLYNSDWPWTSYSKEKAKESKDLSLIYKLGQSVRNKLNEINIYTLEDLYNTKKEDIISVKGIGEKTYDQWMNQIIALKEGKPFILKKSNLPSKKTEIYFDVEGDTDEAIDYLYGLLINDKFTYFWADTPKDEEKLWKEFITFIESLDDDFIIYHYSSYEITSINRMIKRYGISEQTHKKLKEHMVDLFPLLTSSIVLPVYSYSIKPVAKYLGFKWRADDAGGANSMEWYFQFLKGDKTLKQKILDYNEDDVKATKIVKEYLSK